MVVEMPLPLTHLQSPRDGSFNRNRVGLGEGGTEEGAEPRPSRVGIAEQGQTFRGR